MTAANGSQRSGSWQTSGLSHGNSRLMPPVPVLAVVFATLLAFTILLQWLGNSYHSEFGGFPDEPAHFITGLMIRDYVAAGFPVRPIKYAEEYYIHYPKVAFGMWGPLLHLTEGAWMLVFPPSRVSVLVLMAVIASIMATMLFATLRREFGVMLALCAAFVLLAVPTVQAYTGMVMADGLVAMLDFGAALAFGQFLNTHDWKHSLRFGVFACLSILTKGNGMALVFLPLFAIVFTRQFGLLRTRALWAGAAVVVCIAGPWQYYSSKMLIGILDRQPGWTFAPFYTMSVFTVVGFVFAPVMLIGLYDRLIVPMRKGVVHGKWAAAAALICSVWAFHCLIPAAAPEMRYMIAVVPPVLMFSIAGVLGISNRVRVPLPPGLREWACAAILLILFGATAFSIPQKQHHGFDDVAVCLERPEYKNSVILVSSEGDGEGMLISEIAMRERRPSHFVLRASKMLGKSDWNGLHYELLYHTPDELMKFLRTVPVELVVIDNTPGESTFTHQNLLIQTIASVPDEWQHVGNFPTGSKIKSQPTIDVYRLKSVAGQTAGKIRINLPYTLGRAIER